ncbi:hypothetical protein JYU34_013636 [Plutella xylostella]|uniref:Uncharacterized protein n=1 Tax=Plutella xylostella TaxID=51655 RepID=A0ABQ7QAP2_PLUXY|nr:hypothetical protein JYU34_013636 [Plutella xylostella]
MMVAPVQRRTARLLMESLVTNLLQLTCAGIVTTRNLIPLKIIADLLPLDTLAGLCSLITSFTS